MKYLIACLGNIGVEYELTRHNIGFLVADHLAETLDGKFQTTRLSQLARLKHKGRTLVVIKPTTYMNLSGKAIKYWLQQEKLTIDKLLVVVDDIALPLGTLRMKTKGGDAGHNGLEHIALTLGTTDYNRLRFGIGNDFPKGRQVDYVLGSWSDQEIETIEKRIPIASEIVMSFVSIGAARTMNFYNNK
ncbi:MAG: aminoacyl-tRNA hydrolase [Bacteroidales bacterium]|jgi:PTH1 family peptidyl-tRNA hydrolase|nr:aminoacyl-tRNA hydrolase [Bacteroidales bacterium]MDD3701993.1 aminoacyl-tRNA hydrolase [Bacteroidales bacterium]MDY0368983.1 aminoacyl-tRNA hydrolase [Bacteroidales bacterium]